MPSGLKRYLSLAPVLAVLTISLAFSIFIFFNWYFPDRLYFGQ